MKKINKIISICESCNGKKYEEPEHSEISDLCKSALKNDISIFTALELIYDKCLYLLNTGCYNSSFSEISLICRR